MLSMFSVFLYVSILFKSVTCFFFLEYIKKEKKHGKKYFL